MESGLELSIVIIQSNSVILAVVVVPPDTSTFRFIANSKICAARVVVWQIKHKPVRPFLSEVVVDQIGGHIRTGCPVVKSVAYKHSLVRSRVADSDKSSEEVSISIEAVFE